MSVRALPADRIPARWARARARTVTGVVLALALLSACATTPRTAPPIPESLLLSDYSTWFAADVAGNRELLTYVLDELGSQLGGVVTRTDRISGGMLLLPGERVSLSAVAAGAFPAGGVEFVLSTNPDFERERAQIDGRDVSYFRQADGLLQVALPRNLDLPGGDYLYVSSGRVLEMLRDRPPAELTMDPGVYRALRRVGTPYGPAVLVIFDDPGAGLLASLGLQAPALPLTRIDLTLSVARPPAELAESAAVTAEPAGASVAPAADLELGGSLHLRTERDAALFGRIGRVFVLLFVRALGLDGEAVQDQAVIAVDGARVVFSGIPMTRDELVDAIRNLSGGEQ